MFLSRNVHTPSVKESDLERFWVLLGQVEKLYNEHRASPHKEDDDLLIGSPEWATNIVGKVVSKADRQKGLASLLKEPRSWQFISLAAKLPYMRDGQHLTLEMLKRRLRPVESSQMKVKTKAKSATVERRPPDTAGGVSAHALTHAKAG